MTHGVEVELAVNVESIAGLDKQGRSLAEIEAQRIIDLLVDARLAGFTRGWWGCPVSGQACPKSGRAVRWR